MSELELSRDRVFKTYERMCGRKPDMVVHDLLNVLMRDEMRPLMADLIRELDREQLCPIGRWDGGSVNQECLPYTEYKGVLFGAKYDHG